MKNYFTIILIVLTIAQGYSQKDSVEINYGSSTENGKYITVNGNKLYYETYGEGIPLLLLHGGLGSIMTYQYSIAGLSEHFKVIALDSPGHGRSSSVDSLSYQLLEDNISQFIDDLRLDSLYIMGWSDGGIVGLMLAADRSDKVKKLIAIGANTRYKEQSQKNMDWIENQMVEWANQEGGWMKKEIVPLMEEPEKFDLFVENSQKMWMTEISIDTAKVRSITIPTIIMQGDHDPIKLEHALELHRDIKNSDLCILPHAPHYVFYVYGDMINEIAIKFYNRK